MVLSAFFNCDVRCHKAWKMLISISFKVDIAFDIGTKDMFCRMFPRILVGVTS